MRRLCMSKLVLYNLKFVTYYSPTDVAKERHSLVQPFHRRSMFTIPTLKPLIQRLTTDADFNETELVGPTRVVQWGILWAYR